VEAAGIMGTKKTSTMPRTSAAEIPRTAPDDGDSVLAAIRLGWYVAEVGGRNNRNCPQPRAGEARKMVPSPLPLRNERTAAELETEAEGVLGTLAAWQVIALKKRWRDEPQVADSLFLQIRRWYEVIVLLQDPSSLIRPRAIFTNYRAILHGVVAFLPQLLLATGALGLIAWFVDLLNTQAGYAFGKSVLAIAGVLGLSLTSISARLKNTAQSLTLRIKQNAFGDLIAAELTVVPGRPGRLSGLSGRKSKRRDRQMARAVQNRTLTSITPAKCR
jgi:hypothetical protein